MSVVKKPHQKQDTPRMQLVALLQSVWGNVHNVAYRHCTTPEAQEAALERALQHLEEAQDILRGMPEGEWRPE